MTYLPRIPLLNKLQLLFLSCRKLGFITYKKRILIMTPSRRDSFSVTLGGILPFFKCHHTLCGKEGKPSGLAEESVMKIQKTHASKWKEYRGIAAYRPVKWTERQEDWFASSLTCKEKSTKTQWLQEPPPLTNVIVSKQQAQLGYHGGKVGIPSFSTIYPPARSCSSAKLIVYQAASPAQGSD